MAGSRSPRFDVVTDDRSPEDWGDLYQRERPTFDEYARELGPLLTKLLESARIPFSQVDVRAKEVDSFVAKVRREGDRYSAPLQQVTDLAGARIVVLYSSDVARVGELIDAEFDVDWENSQQWHAAVEPDRFGYASDHYIVRSGRARASLREWRSYAGLRAEVQVRTVLQHAWAAISHSLAYKSELEVRTT
jgi:ppGpp synthetase/RelA/SpoT-type nucleotidyltranferase